jgi:hypothetical protein
MHHQAIFFAILCTVVFASMALASYSPGYAYGNVTYYGRNNVYGGYFASNGFSSSAAVSLPHRGFGFSSYATPTTVGISAYYYRNQKHGDDDCDDECEDDGGHYRPSNSGHYDYAQVQYVPYHGYWHGEGDHVYVYNSAIYN